MQEQEEKKKSFISAEIERTEKRECFNNFLHKISNNQYTMYIYRSKITKGLFGYRSLLKTVY